MITALITVVAFTLLFVVLCGSLDARLNWPRAHTGRGRRERL